MNTFGTILFVKRLEQERNAEPYENVSPSNDQGSDDPSLWDAPRCSVRQTVRAIGVDFRFRVSEEQLIKIRILHLYPAIQTLTLTSAYRGFVFTSYNVSVIYSCNHGNISNRIFFHQFSLYFFSPNKLSRPTVYIYVFSLICLLNFADNSLDHALIVEAYFRLYLLFRRKFKPLISKQCQFLSIKSK